MVLSSSKLACLTQKEMTPSPPDSSIFPNFPTESLITYISSIIVFFWICSTIIHYWVNKKYHKFNNDQIFYTVDRDFGGNRIYSSDSRLTSDAALLENFVSTHAIPDIYIHELCYHRETTRDNKSKKVIDHDRKIDISKYYQHSPLPQSEFYDSFVQESKSGFKSLALLKKIAPKSSPTPSTSSNILTSQQNLENKRLLTSTSDASAPFPSVMNGSPPEYPLESSSSSSSASSSSGDPSLQNLCNRIIDEYLRQTVRKATNFEVSVKVKRYKIQIQPVTLSNSFFSNQFTNLVFILATAFLYLCIQVFRKKRGRDISHLRQVYYSLLPNVDENSIYAEMIDRWNLNVSRDRRVSLPSDDATLVGRISLTIDNALFQPKLSFYKHDRESLWYRAHFDPSITHWNFIDPENMHLPRQVENTISKVCSDLNIVIKGCAGGFIRRPIVPFLHFFKVICLIALVFSIILGFAATQFWFGNTVWLLPVFFLSLLITLIISIDDYYTTRRQVVSQAIENYLFLQSKHDPLLSALNMSFQLPDLCIGSLPFNLM